MRFKLKTPFFEYARDQVKGGIWYRPTWWDAVSSVPPAHFQPRIRKRDVPAITFLEDRLVRCVGGVRTAAPRAGCAPALPGRRCSGAALLARRACPTPAGALLTPLPLALPTHSPSPCRRFQARNPAIAAFDRQRGGEAAAASMPTVTRQFIDQQMEAMRNGTSELAAYAATRNWLLGNGPRLFAQLDVPAQIRSVVAQSPAALVQMRNAGDQAVQEQLAATQRVLAQLRSGGGGSGRSRLGGGSGGGDSGGSGGAGARSGATAQQQEAIARRALSGDPQLPRRPSGQ